ncbi:MAG: hypothetical protein O7A71_07910 [Chloroflexi bacterium]|nr:hypothetical protein [Chloroflexota bacterium]
MARDWTFLRGPGKDRADLPDTTADDLVDLWAGTPELRPDSIWERIANDLGEQVAPRWYIPPRLAPMLETQRRVAATAATLAIVLFASTVVAMSGGATGESGYRTDLSLLAMTTSQALNDGVLSPGELDSLNAVAAELTDYFADPERLDRLTNAELDQTIGTLAATRAALLETGSLDVGSQQTLSRLAELSAIAIRARVSRGPLQTLVMARRLDPESAVETEIFAADELPLSIAVDGAGAIQLLGSVAGLELGAVTTLDGWSSQAVRTFGRSVMTHFSGGAESVEVGATLRDGTVVLQVVRTTTESSDGTTTAEPSGVAEIQTFPVRTAGLVVLSVAGDALRLQDVQSEPGWIGSVVSDADQVEVTFSNSSSRLRFSARLRNGVIHSEVRALQVVPPTFTQFLETPPAADPPAADPPVAPTGDDPPPVDPAGDDPPPVDPPGDDPPPVDPPADDPPPAAPPADAPPPAAPPPDDPPPAAPPADDPAPVAPPSDDDPAPVAPPADDPPPVEPPADDPPPGDPPGDHPGAGNGNQGDNGNHGDGTHGDHADGSGNHGDGNNGNNEPEAGDHGSSAGGPSDQAQGHAGDGAS